MRLDDTGRRAIFLAEGLGHGFMTLSEQATVLYLCSASYAPGREHGVHPLDPAIGIAWPLGGLDDGPILSAKDAEAPRLEEALLSGALPDYADCTARTARPHSPAARRIRSFLDQPRSAFANSRSQVTCNCQMHPHMRMHGN